MSTTLTPDNTQAVPANLVGPSDGPTAHASDVNTPFQSLLNWLARALLRRIADFAALRAIANQVDGERLYVSFEGWYEWRASDTATESVPWIISPGGTGRWYHVDYLKRPLVYVYKLASFGNVLGASTSTAYVDVPNAYVDVPGCEVGDELLIDASCELSSDSATPAHASFATLAIVDPTPTTTVLDETRVTAFVGGTNGTEVSAAMRTVFTVGVAGTQRVKLQARTVFNTDHVTVNGPIVVRAQRIRRGA